MSLVTFTKMLAGATFPASGFTVAAVMAVFTMYLKFPPVRFVGPLVSFLLTEFDGLF